ncbi:MAG: prepilin-type N-terminal cleavage/methylation domain-containing protein [Acidobacteriota bacterium]|jgi:prepilin-type N-terminal cleavage/methylation domain-containing protein
MESSRSRARGFTLLEALVVVALLGIAVTIVAGTLQNTYQKMRLETAVNNIDSLLESAHAAMVSTQAEVFFGLVAGPPFRLRVARDAALSNVIEEYVVPDYVNFSMGVLGAVDTNWPAAASNGPWRLRLDTFGRTTTVTGAPVTAVQTLTVTHRDVVTGRLKPRLRYEVRVYPLWRVDVGKEVME